MMRYVFEVTVTVEPGEPAWQQGMDADDDITIAVKNAMCDGGFFCAEYVQPVSAQNCTVTLIRTEAP